jgi:hypothetical protein
MYSNITAYLASLSAGVEVPIPKPEAPDPQDVLDGGQEGANWFASQGQAFWTIVIVAVMATIAMKAFKNPLVKGGVITIILIGIIAAILYK